MKLIGLTCILLAGAANAGFSSSQSSTSDDAGTGRQDGSNFQARGHTKTYASPNAIAYAHFSVGLDNYLQAQNLAFHQQIQQQALEHAAAIQAQVQQQIQSTGGGAYAGGSYNGVPYGGAYGGGYGGGNAGYPNYAGSSASIGPQGIHHQGYINPANPASPNFDTRFDTDPVVGGNPGSYGVSSTSFSASSNVDGVENNKRGTVTTVNDNGKVTTYETHS